MRFRPAPIPTFFVAVALVILVNLGMWQLRRHGEKQDRLAQVEARLTQAPASAEELAERPPDDLAWRLGALEGRYHEEQALVSGRFEFGRPGLDIVQPLETSAGPVLVNRGWIPLEGWSEHLREVGTPEGTVRVRGLLLPLDDEAFDAEAAPLPPTESSPERWLPGSYPAIAASMGLEGPGVVLVEGESLASPADKRPEPLPVTGFIARPKALPHLEYAGTWFLIGLTLLALWTWAGFRRGAARG